MRTFGMFFHYSNYLNCPLKFMKYSTLILIFLLPFCTKSFSANHTEKDIRLFTFCKVWGCLKYCHPNSSTRSDFDLFLLKNLEKVKNCNDIEFNIIIGDFIASLGLFTKNSHSSNPTIDSSRFRWIDLSVILNNSNKKALKMIIKAGNGNGSLIRTERNCSDKAVELELMKVEDSMEINNNVALLSLFKYWNIVNFFYPYKNILPRNWDSTLYDYASEFDTISSRKSYVLLLNRLTTELHDCHTFIIPRKKHDKLFGQYYPDFCIEFMNDTTFISWIDSSSTLQIGDIIESINDTTISEYRNKFKTIYGCSTPVSLESRINIYLLSGNLGRIFRLKVNRAGNLLNIEVILKNRVMHWWEGLHFQTNVLKKIDKDIILFEPGLVHKETLKMLKNELKHSKAVIVDMRYNSDYDFPNWFIKNNRSFCTSYHPNNKIPGDFLASSEYSYFYKLGCGKKYKGQIFVLVNENTQSSLEFETLRLKYGSNAILIGSNTSGTDGNVCSFRLPGQIDIYATFYGISNPGGKLGQTDHRPSDKAHHLIPV